MAYDRVDYYAEGLAEFLDEAGVVATPEQIRQIAEGVAGAVENVGQAFYQPENPAPRREAELQRELAKERSKVVCPQCKGGGRLYFQGPYHSSDTGCWKCHGEGKVIP